MNMRYSLHCAGRNALLWAGLFIAPAASLSAAPDGSAGAEFLRLGVGSPLGMQEASGAVARDVTAIYWNPAGLAALREPEVYTAHRTLPETLQFNFLGAAVPLFQKGPLPGVLGYSFQVLSQDPLERLDNAGNPAGRFSALDTAHTLAWASRWDRTRAGVTLRWIRQSIDDAKGSALAAGFGVQRDLGEAGSAGLSVDNAGGRLRLNSEEFALPLTCRIGGSYGLLQNSLLLASDLTLPKGRPPQWHLGLAYRIFPLRGGSQRRNTPGVTARFGYTVEDRDSDGPQGYAAGLSTELGALRADFSYQPFGKLGNSLQAGVGYRFR